MGHKILDVKADIHEDVEAYFKGLDVYSYPTRRFSARLSANVRDSVLEIVDKHFQKIER